MECGGVAWAIPNSQHICQTGFVEEQSTDFVPVRDDFFVNVNNGFFSRNCIVTLSADASAHEGDRLEIAYSFDGGACVFSGPLAFHLAESGSLETHTAVTVVKLGKGVHTIQPCFRVQKIDGDGGGISFGQRCLIVECWTN